MTKNHDADSKPQPLSEYEEEHFRSDPHDLESGQRGVAKSRWQLDEAKARAAEKAETSAVNGEATSDSPKLRIAHERAGSVWGELTRRGVKGFSVVSEEEAAQIQQQAAAAAEEEAARRLAPAPELSEVGDAGQQVSIEEPDTER